jgi:hypothetical protein
MIDAISGEKPAPKLIRRIPIPPNRTRTDRPQSPRLRFSYGALHKFCYVAYCVPIAAPGLAIQIQIQRRRQNPVICTGTMLNAQANW